MSEFCKSDDKHYGGDDNESDDDESDDDSWDSCWGVLLGRGCLEDG
jgi:hypothetical protein